MSSHKHCKSPPDAAVIHWSAYICELTSMQSVVMFASMPLMAGAWGYWFHPMLYEKSIRRRGGNQYKLLSKWKTRKDAGLHHFMLQKKECIFNVLLYLKENSPENKGERGAFCPLCWFSGRIESSFMLRSLTRILASQHSITIFPLCSSAQREGGLCHIHFLLAAF